METQWTIHFDADDKMLVFGDEFSAFWYLWDYYLEQNEVTDLETYKGLLNMFRQTHELPNFGCISEDVSSKK